MGIEDPTPQAALDPTAQDSQVRPGPAAPSWADESTVAIPLSELFADKAEE
jgi:hypothetical protein